MPTAVLTPNGEFHSWLYNGTAIPTLPSSIIGAVTLNRPYGMDPTNAAYSKLPVLGQRIDDTGLIPSIAVITGVQLVVTLTCSWSGNTFNSNFVSPMIEAPLVSGGWSAFFVNEANEIQGSPSGTWTFNLPISGPVVPSLYGGNYGLFGSEPIYPAGLIWDWALANGSGTVEFTQFELHVTYTLISLTSVSPNTGPLLGGDTITLTGAAFTDGMKVNWDNEQIDATFVDSTHLTIVAPVRSTERVIDVTVYDPATGAYATLEDAYSYLTIPAILSVTPSSGSMAGGTDVVIIGRGFVSGSNILFGGQQATNIVYVSPTEYHATTPAHQIGLVDVLIVEP